MSNVTSATTKVNKPFRPIAWIKGFTLAACGVIAIAIGWVATTQVMAARELTKYKNDLKSQGIPIDNASVEKTLDERTNPEGSETFRSIVKLARWGSSLASVDSIPIVGAGLATNGASDSIINWKEWPSDAVPERFVSDYLTEMEPMFVLLEQLAKMPKPVRIDLQVDGLNTLFYQLQESRNVMNVLSLEARYAIFKKDKTRALRAIRSMTSVNEALDSPGFIVWELQLLAYQGILLSIIQESMAFEFWDQPDIAALKELIENARSRSIPWKEVMECERAIVMATLDSHEGLAWDSEVYAMVPKLPSAKLKLMRHYGDLIEAGSLPLEKRRERFSEVSQETNSLINLWDGSAILAGLILPQTSAIIDVTVRHTDSLRFAYLACALREYKLAKDKWPADLDELSSLGVPRDVLASLERGPFGYQVEADKAWLWSYDIRNNREPKIGNRPTDSTTSQYQSVLSFE
ncbi:MAG: hypothetical protein MUC43_05910 [Pirellula sp.]|nr:hypothetical protein [Pirellula sp.]